MIKELEKVKKPIIYICLSIILASISYGIFDKNKWLTIISVSLFFIYIIIEVNWCFAIVILGFFIMQIGVNYLYYNSINNKCVNDEIRIIENKDYYILGKYKGKLVYLNNLNTTVVKGDKLYINGEFNKDEDLEKGIVGSINIKKYNKCNEDLLCKLNNIPVQIFNKLEENIGKRKAALVVSVSLGYREFLDSEDEEDMRDLGIIHAISVSGLHVALVFGVCKRFFSDKTSLVISFIYVLITGAEFSSLRSILMIVILVTAKNSNKNYYSIVSLLLSATINILIQPYAIFNLGFILSYVSTIGILLFSKRIRNKLRNIPHCISSTIAISLAAQIFTIPIIIVIFGEVSITFIIGNMLIVPLLNIIIYLGNLLIIFSFSENIFDFISFILLKLIKVIDIVMNKLYTISNGGLIINEKIATVYIMCLISFYFIYKGYKKFYMLPVISLIFMFISIYSPVPKIDYIDKGVILISYKGERNIISTQNNVNMKELKKRYFAQEGFRLIKKVVINNEVILNSKNKDFILRINKKEYYLKLNKYSKIKQCCDVISFVDEEARGFYIISDRIIIY